MKRLLLLTTVLLLLAFGYANAQGWNYDNYYNYDFDDAVKIERDGSSDWFNITYLKGPSVDLQYGIISFFISDQPLAPGVAATNFNFGDFTMPDYPLDYARRAGRFDPEEIPTVSPSAGMFFEIWGGPMIFSSGWEPDTTVFGFEYFGNASDFYTYKITKDFFDDEVGYTNPAEVLGELWTTVPVPQAPTAVPEPATLLGFGVPMLMAGIGRLRMLRK